MKRKILIWIITIPLLILVLFSCSKPGNKNQGMEGISMEEANAIELEPLKNITLEEDALLSMNYPGEFQTMDTGEQRFSYETVNFKLGEATIFRDYSLKNTDLGKHIALILNNEQILHEKSPEFTVHLEPGHYVALSFLARSNYESLKGSEAYVIRQFYAGKTVTPQLDLNGPNLFYYAPSGKFSGRDCEEILLDFFIINCSLSPDSYRVRVIINDSDFIISEWMPYVIRNLPDGESTIALELIGPDGVRVGSPFNSTTRKISLTRKDPA